MAGRKFLAVALVISGIVVAGTPAGAQCRLCSTPSTTPDQKSNSKPVELQIESSLRFDRLVLSGAGQGSAMIRPDGSSSAQGAIDSVSARAMVGSATVHGEPGRTVRIELPRRISLYSLSGGEITFDDVVSDLPSLPRLDSAGNLRFRFGGRLTVNGDAEGDYRGDLSITVEYL
jgi:Domain of unknown function (DUF4402)